MTFVRGCVTGQSQSRAGGHRSSAVMGVLRMRSASGAAIEDSVPSGAGHSLAVTYLRVSSQPTSAKPASPYPVPPRGVRPGVAGGRSTRALRRLPDPESGLRGEACSDRRLASASADGTRGSTRAGSPCGHRAPRGRPGCQRRSSRFACLRPPARAATRTLTPLGPDSRRHPGEGPLVGRPERIRDGSLGSPCVRSRGQLDDDPEVLPRNRSGPAPAGARGRRRRRRTVGRRHRPLRLLNVAVHHGAPVKAVEQATGCSVRRVTTPSTALGV